MAQVFDKQGNKLYPINIDKHQHNVDYAITKCKNLIEDELAKPKPDLRKVEGLEERLEKYEEVFMWLMGGGGVVHVPGWVIGEAKGISLWADEMRAENRRVAQC